jgi:putative glutamine amidotransferase
MPSEQPPIVGITCIEIQARSPRPPRFGQNQSYLRALIRAGAAPLLIPNLVDKAMLRRLYEQMDGVLLPGGEDMDPAFYDEAPHEKLGHISPERDRMEISLARWAVDEGKPLLALCRGIQVLNVALGGSLYQDIETQIPGAEKHDWSPDFPRDRLSHSVVVVPGTRLAQIVGAGSLLVNSMHHQALKDVAPALTVVARAQDETRAASEIIEAAEIKDHPFAVAVQWHPEELASGDARAQGLFDALVMVCRSRQSHAPSAEGASHTRIRIAS